MSKVKVAFGLLAVTAILAVTGSGEVILEEMRPDAEFKGPRPTTTPESRKVSFHGMWTPSPRYNGNAKDPGVMVSIWLNGKVDTDAAYDTAPWVAHRDLTVGTTFRMRIVLKPGDISVAGCSVLVNGVLASEAWDRNARPGEQIQCDGGVR